MSVASELSSDIAAAFLRRDSAGNVEALLEAALVARSVLQYFSAGDRPRRPRKRDEATTATCRGGAASVAS